MIEDVETYRGTILIWSCLGGGAIGPQWLEHEAYGKIDPRLRIYGHLNDSEFIAECQKRNIKVLGVIFCCQMWEFPIETNEDETEMLSFNVLRNVGKKGWLGVRELSTDRYPKMFKSFKNYFPNGLTNSNGEKVSDLLEECRARDLHDEPIFSEWLQVVGHDHRCYTPCKNNPVMISYLKKLIEIQIDAGVDGIHFDEFASQMTVLERGGCFCKDCMKGFREYLQRVGCSILSDDELEDFDYGRYLRGRGFNFKEDRKQAPLIKEYKNFCLERVFKNMKELSSYAREYAQKQGREILISQNHYEIFDIYYPMVKYADIIGGEKAKLGVRQSEWYRTALAFSQSKPTVYIEDPFRSIIPEMYSNIRQAKDDLYTLFILESFVNGIDMSIPYGGWLGNKARDSFWPPRSTTQKIGEFLDTYSHLFKEKSYSKVCLFYPFPNLFDSPYRLRWDEYHEGIYWDLAKFLSEMNINYDVIYLADGTVVEDILKLSTLNDYKVCILPDVQNLTDNQVKVFSQYIKTGRNIILVSNSISSDYQLKGKIIKGDKGYKIIPLQEREKIVSEIKGALKKEFSVEISPSYNIGLQFYDIGDNQVVMHVLNYGYSSDTGKIDPIKRVEISLNLGRKIDNAYLVPFENCNMEANKDFNVIVLENLHIYCAVVFCLIKHETPSLERPGT